MSPRIDVFHSGIGARNDLLVRNPLDVLVREEVQWLPYAVGTKNQTVDAYPPQNFSLSVAAAGNTVTDNSSQAPSYQIIEYQKRVADFQIEASLSRADSFSYTITATCTDSMQITHSFNGSVAYEEGSKKLSTDTVATMMVSYLSGRTASTYSISVDAPNATASVAFRKTDGSAATQAEIDAGSTYVFGSTTAITRWATTESWSSRYDTVARTYTAREYATARSIAAVSQFIPKTARQTYAMSGTQYLAAPNITRTSTAQRSDGTTLLNSEPRLETGRFGQALQMNASVGDQATIPGTLLTAANGAFSAHIKLLRAPGTTAQYIFDGNGVANRSLQVYVSTAGLLTLQFGTGAATVTINCSTPLVANTFYAIAFRWSANGVKLMVDDNSASSAQAPSLAFGATTYLGCQSNGTAQLDGLIDDLMISKIARSDAEISAVKETIAAPDSNTTYYTSFDFAPWMYYFDTNNDGQPDAWPSIHYVFTDTSGDANIGAYVEGHEGTSPYTFDTTAGAEDTSNIMIHVPATEGVNVHTGAETSITVTYPTEWTLAVTATLTNAIMQVTKKADETREDHLQMPWNNAMFYWKSNNSSDTELASDTLGCSVETLETLEIPWTSDRVQMQGTANGAVDGISKQDWLADLPAFTVPAGTTVTGYDVIKLSVNGKTAAGDEQFDALVVTTEDEKIRASSSYKTSSTQKTTVRAPLNGGVMEQFFGILDETTLVDTFNKPTGLVLDDVHYEIYCSNPSVEMWAEDDATSTCSVYATRRATELDKWNPLIHRGFYYLNDEEFFLPALLTEETYENVTTPIYLMDISRAGSPIMALLQDGTELRQVTKTSYDEEFLGNGTNTFYAKFNNITVTALTVDKVIIDAATVSTSDNKIICPEAYSIGAKVQVSYRLNNSFAIERGEGWAKATFDSSYPSITIYYEGKSNSAYYTASELILNPVYNSGHNGFIFLTDLAPTAQKLNIYATPQVLPADGYSVARIIVEVLDSYNNPVYNYDVSIAGGSIVGSTSAKTDMNGRCSFTVQAPAEAGTVTYQITSSLGNSSKAIEFYAEEG